MRDKLCPFPISLSRRFGKDPSRTVLRTTLSEVVTGKWLHTRLWTITHKTRVQWEGEPVWRHCATPASRGRDPIQTLQHIWWRLLVLVSYFCFWGKVIIITGPLLPDLLGNLKRNRKRSEVTWIKRVSGTVVKKRLLWTTNSTDRERCLSHSVPCIERKEYIVRQSKPLV